MSENTKGVYSRRRFLRQASALAAGSVLAGCVGAPARRSARPSRPNILFIAVDDLRTQLGCYGHPQTLSPNIDRLAAEGMVFGRAYCQVPVCGASRASLLTGIRPDFATRRFTNANTRADVDVPAAITLPEHFKNNGWHTLSNGKIFHFVQDSRESWSGRPYRVYDYDTDGAGDWGAVNFDKLWLDSESRRHVSARGRGPFWEAADVPDDAYEDGMTAARTIKDLRRLSQKDQPFFLACGFSRPHLPFNAPKRYYDLYDPAAIELAGNRFPIADKPRECTNSDEIRSYSLIDGWPDDPAFHRRALHGYYACVSYVDSLIGRILDELNTLGLDQNTIVVLWGDHGWHLGEHNFWGKHNTLNNALQVPLVLLAPGLTQGRTTNRLVEFIDLYPTLCELSNLPAPQSHTLDGRSFVPLLTNPDRDWKEAVFSEWRSGRAVKTDRYLYTEWTSGSKMLFDHAVDPYENQNVADDPQYQSIVAHHAALLQKT